MCGLCRSAEVSVGCDSKQLGKETVGTDNF